MRKKSAVVMIMSLALTGAVLTGCGASRQPSQETKQEITSNMLQETQVDTVVDEVETETVGKMAQVTSGYEDNFAVDSKAAKEFAEKVKAAAADKNLDALADMTAFPVYVGLPDAGVVETKEDF